MKIKTFSILVFAVLTIILMSCSSSDNKSSADKGSSSKTTPVAPGFMIADVDGNSHSFTEYVGVSPLVLNFWGTWCPPCKREIPDLIRIYNEYKPQGLEIIGIAVNDTPGRVKKFAAEYGIEWVLLMANRESVMNFKIGAGIPVTIFLDKNGNETGRFIGFRTYDDFKAQVEKII
jgi:thiol-disulfide isomerase/thioredoxin